MLIELNKSDLILETQGLASDINICASSSPHTYYNLQFEGFAGFNEKYAQSLFELLAKPTSKANSIYRTIRLVGNLHNDDAMHQADFYVIKNARDTQFLFKTIKSFSVTIPDLRLGYEYVDTKNEVLYLDRKIIKILNNLDDEPRRELTMYFYCLAKFFRAFNKVNPPLDFDSTGRVRVNAEDLSKMYAEYPALKDKTLLEIIQLKEDVCFGDVQYLNTPYTSPTKENIELKFSSTFVYNVIKTKDSEKLCLINTITKEYYIVDIEKGTVYTNHELKEFNTFEYTEWLPYLIGNLYSLKGTLPFYRIKFLTLDMLLVSKDPEVIISNDASNFEKLLECYPTITENNNMKLYEGYFKGSVIKSEGAINDLKSMYDSDPYAQELYKQEQDYYENFDLKDLTGVVKGVAKGDVYSMLFEGESGTGKSTAARVIASRCGLPFIALNCSTNIEESDIFGAMIPNPEKVSADDAEFIWQDGPMTKAIRNGYVCIVEELGFGRPGVLGKINSLLDESRQIDLPNGEVLKAHPNFRIIATTNIGYEGTNRLNKALVNRFEICKKFTDLDEREAKDIIMSRTGYTDADKINKVFEVYRAIKKYSEENNLGLVVSIRQLLNIFKQGKYYKSAKDAVYNLLINQAFLEEPDHLNQFVDKVLGVFSLSFKI